MMQFLLLAWACVPKDSGPHSEGTPSDTDTDMDTDTDSDTDADTDTDTDTDTETGVYPIEVREDVTVLVTAAAGGEIDLGSGEFRLIVPPGAVSTDVEVTVTTFDLGPGFYVLQPSGLVFAEPATASFRVDETDLVDEAGDALFPLLAHLDDDGRLLLPEEVAVVRDPDVDGSVRVEVEVPHFSSVVYLRTTAGVSFQKVTPGDPVEATVNAPFALEGLLGWGAGFLVRLPTWGEELLGLEEGLRVEVTSLEVRWADAVAAPTVYTLRGHYQDLGRFLAEHESIAIRGWFYCLGDGTEGEGEVEVGYTLESTLEGDIDWVVSAYETKVHGPSSWRLRVGGTYAYSPYGESTLVLRKDHHGLDWKVRCTDYGYAYGTTDRAWEIFRRAVPDPDDLPALASSVDDLACTLHSTGSSCLDPAAAQTLGAAVPAVLEADPGEIGVLGDELAAAGGLVFSATERVAPGVSPDGPWLSFLMTLAADVPLDATDTYHQIAIVMDANGDPADNYTAPEAYPADGFDGTDLWVELVHDPSSGWAAQVRRWNADTGAADPVASDATWMVLGPDLFLLIPRDEIEAASVSWRAYTFEHDGWYGLHGHAWSGDLAPTVAEGLSPFDEVSFELLVPPVDVDGDGAFSDVDCDDRDDARSPGTPDTCDGVDNDCDGLVDADDPDADLDGDDDGEDTVSCGGTDCRDDRADVGATQPERCDGVDNDCDLAADEDDDGDGADACSDCDNGDPLVAPGLIEVCDGRDNDCSGIPDDGDRDGDGSGICEDCAPDDGSIHPGAVELCDGVDSDCDLVADEFDAVTTDADADGDRALACGGSDCDDEDPTRSTLDLDLDGLTSCDGDCDDLDPDVFVVDLDGDGVGTCQGDCDDADPDRYPYAWEATDGVDNDCDGYVDAADPDVVYSDTLSEADWLLASFAAFRFPFCGTDWSSVYMNSTGRLTFGFWDTNISPSSSTFVNASEEASIAPLWNWYRGGPARWIEHEDAAVFYWLDYEEAVEDLLTDLTVVLHADGRILFHYGVGGTSRGLAGWSCTTGVGSSDQVDLGSYAGAPAPGTWAASNGTSDAMFENFSGSGSGDPFDLSGQHIALCAMSGTDGDGDGWADRCGDCDDSDPLISPDGGCGP